MVPGLQVAGRLGEAGDFAAARLPIYDFGFTIYVGFDKGGWRSHICTKERQGENLPSTVRFYLGALERDG